MSDVKWQGAEQGPMVTEQEGEVLIFDRALTSCEIAKLSNGVELREVHAVRLDTSSAGHVNFGKPQPMPEGEMTFTLKGRVEPTPEQVVAEIKAEISRRIEALPKADFNAAAEVVGAVLNEYIDRGQLLDDEHALTEAVAEVLDGVSG